MILFSLTPPKSHTITAQESFSSWRILYVKLWWASSGWWAVWFLSQWMGSTDSHLPNHTCLLLFLCSLGLLFWGGGWWVCLEDAGCEGKGWLCFLPRLQPTVDAILLRVADLQLGLWQCLGPSICTSAGPPCLNPSSVQRAAGAGGNFHVFSFGCLTYLDLSDHWLTKYTSIMANYSVLQWEVVKAKLALARINRR